MTLSTVPAYDPSAVPTIGSHAVVVGGSIAGLLAARVLADGYDRVTLLERDPMPDEPVARRGVPQDEHVHVMLEPARVVMNDLFSGYQADLRAEGALLIDVAKQLEHYEQGGYLASPRCDLPMLCASRPLFEQIARRHTVATSGITVRPECHFTDYVMDESETAVVGVTFRNECGEIERSKADLVVDATGRTSHTHRWLADHGYPRPPVDHVAIDLAYSTVTVERASNEERAYLCAPSPPDPKGGTAVPIEGNRLLVTLFGMHGDHPPTEREGFIEFATRLATPAIATLLRERPWVSDDIERYPFPSDQWRHYAELKRFPDGLVVTGDALASFNPIYGQGMSAAALDALQLHHTIADGETAVGPRFFARAEAHLDSIWRTAVGADFEFEATEGSKPFGTDLLNRYVSRLIETAHHNRRVAEEFVRVLRLEKPPRALFRPGIAARVLFASR